MEKYNMIVKIEEIKRLTENGETERAVRAADSIDIPRLRTVSDLSIVGEAYIRGKEYEKARRVYEKLYERSHSRRVVMQLVNLSIKLKDVEAAEDYLQDFMDIAPDDFYRFIFRYSIDKLRGESYEVLIDSLERLKKKEYLEKWAYELAKLYHKAGLDQKCVDECSDIILWFGDGQYVERAKALRSYYYGELDLGWLEESQLMETRPIPPLNLSAPKEPVPFKRPAPEEPKKDERFERKMTGGYVSPIGGEVRPAAGGRPFVSADQDAMGMEPLPVIQTEGLFDEPEPAFRLPDEPSESRGETGRKRPAGTEEERENLFKAVIAPRKEDEEPEENLTERQAGESEQEAAAAAEPIAAVEPTAIPEKAKEAEEEEDPKEEPKEPEWGKDSIAEEIRRKEQEERKSEAASAAENRTETKAASILEFPGKMVMPEPAEDSPLLIMFRDSLEDQGLSFESLFGLYSHIPGMEEQLAGALSDTVTGEAVQYNYRIVGEKSTGKTALAKNLSKYLYKTGCISTPKVALISAEKLNRINLIQKKEALADCCLIVEGAGSLNTSAAAGLAHVIRTFNGRLAVILEDTKENMDRLAMDREPLIRLFKPAIELPRYTSKSLADFVCGLLSEKDYHMLEGARDGLTDCLRRCAETGSGEMNLELAKKIADQAIEKAEKRSQAELLKFAESGQLGKADLEGIAAEDFMVEII